jgi:hypothetical protein
MVLVIAAAYVDFVADLNQQVFCGGDKGRYTRIGDRIVNVAASLLTLYQAAVPQTGQVQRNIGLGEAGLGHNVRHAPGLAEASAENSQARLVGKALEERREDLLS